MMRKTLWALALLFVLSGCSDGGEDTPPKQDDLVTTTFNIEYSLNLDTPSINYPSSYNQQSPAPGSGVPTLSDGVAMRFIVELWEEVPVNAADPSAGMTYKRYNRKQWGILQHTPVPGQADKYIFTNTARIAKGKYKMLMWADYVRSNSLRSDGTFSSNLLGSYFDTRNVDKRDPNKQGLRALRMEMAGQRPDTDPLKDLYDAFSGVSDVDFTVYEGINHASATVEGSVERIFGKYTLIATDLQDYKDLFTEQEYEGTKKPLEVKLEYQSEYDPETTDEDDEDPVNGYRWYYDVLDQTVSRYEADRQKQHPVVSEDGSEMILTFDYPLATANNDPLTNVKLTIYGPMDYPIAKLKISRIPVERNKETFFRAKFFTNAWESGETGEGGITITDDFDTPGKPSEI